MMKQDPLPTTTLTTICGQCGIVEPKLLHHIRLRGNFRRLCTSCVLRLHPQFFCPACLGVYDRSPPDDAVVCYKCYSSSHPACVLSSAPTPVASRNPSPCASCLNPNLLLFNLTRLDAAGFRVVDVNSARLLLAAAKIAAMSMSKAEVAAASEAERRSKEAAYTKKRAKEALDHVVKLMGKEKMNMLENNNNNNNTNNKVIINNSSVVRKVDDSSEVVKALNAVELKDNGTPVEKIVGESKVVMEVDDSGGKDENGGVKDNELVKVVENGEDQGDVEKNNANANAVN
ncbi:uncharacterized protein LOC143564598 [Bidens hawaiensis]|uniref:uncharacterized protein LOC143564598 n=1 Tax=Bidens hawaiensis TaxID=980011 RepID=UPI00404B2A6B